MTDFLAGRAQMGLSLAFHIVFASLGVGLPVLIAAAHFLGLRRRDEVWMRLAVRLTRAFTVLVVVGVISGIVISVELVLLWPQFMAAAGPVIGLPFSLETYAFFLEAIFLSLYLFGRNKLSPWVHWATILPVCLGGLASAWIVVAANAWMNAPTGFDYVHGQFTHPDPFAAILNPAMPAETFHMVASAYVATGLTVAGVFAFGLLRGRDRAYLRRGIMLSMVLVALWIVPLVLAGDMAGRMIANEQPAKLAAAEGLQHTQREAPLGVGFTVGGTKYGVEIPDGLSLLVGRNPHTLVKGLDATPTADRPPVGMVRNAFSFMAGAGVFLGLLTFIYWFARWKRPRWLTGRPLLGGLVLAGPLAFATIESGWIVTEVGRQPWIVYGYMRTKGALTSSPLVGLMFLIFSLLYVLLSVLTVLALKSEMRLLPRVATRTTLPPEA